jgi:1-acyl-sn-glycerol-3-phosphate acyltransferase
MRDEDLIDILHHPIIEKSRYHLAEVLAHYFRLKVHGVKRLPATGPAIVVANHSGFAGFDAIMICHLLRKYAKRPYKVVAHRAYFDMFQSLRVIARSFGFTEAKLAKAQETLEQNEMLLLFPEGEQGNFKSSWQRYMLRPFHTGFVRLALATGAPIYPCLVVGAEETNFNLGNINLSRFIDHLVVPLPLNVLPLPAKWSIEFLSPIRLDKESKSHLNDHDWIHEKTREIQLMMQQKLKRKVRARRSIYW